MDKDLEKEIMDKALREMVDLVLICGDLLGIDVKKEFPTLYELFKRKNK